MGLGTAADLMSVLLLGLKFGVETGPALVPSKRYTGVLISPLPGLLPDVFILWLEYFV
jgi:hypothetical protein